MRLTSGQLVVFASLLIPLLAHADVDLGGYQLSQTSSTQSFVFPSAVVGPGTYVIVSRSSSQAEFEAFWGPLPPNVVFFDSGGLLPQINGDESYALQDPIGTVIDGPTIAMPSGGGSSINRISPGLPAGEPMSWTEVPATSATPGSGAGPALGTVLVINEFSDAAGSGNFIHEFVELYYDEEAVVLPSVSPIALVILAAILPLLGSGLLRAKASRGGARLT